MDTQARKDKDQKQGEQKAYRRHVRFWAFLQLLLHSFIVRRFRLESAQIDVDGPILLVSNHVTTWDPLLVAMALRKKQIYFVASEHIFRKGFLSRLLMLVFGPIARRKGDSGLDTAMRCVRHLRAGHSVCVFAEGEQSWDGRSIPVMRGTGSLARRGGATLVTYRIIGGYLSLPRWGTKIRRGRVRGEVAGIYPPEQLAKMKAEEINALIDRDIYVDAFADQEKEPVRYTGKAPAEKLERAFYLCPQCRRTDGLSSKGDRIFCKCGFELKYGENCFFEAPDGLEPRFRTIPEWEDWQKEALVSRDFVTEEDGALFRDSAAVLTKVGTDHSTEILGEGPLAMYEDRLVCAGKDFPTDTISDVAMTRYNVLLFSAGEAYYEIRTDGDTNVRKYYLCIKEKGA